MRSIITAISHYEPERIITNEDIADFHFWALGSGWTPYTKKEIIEKAMRAWIVERRWVWEEENAITMAISAVENLKEEYWKSILENIDGIYVWSLTSPYHFPSMAAQIAQVLNLQVDSHDINNACVGFLSWMDNINDKILLGKNKKSLMIGADMMSGAINKLYPKVWVLFGDGAGAVLIEALDNDNYGIQGSLMKTFPDKLHTATMASRFKDNTWLKSGDFLLDWPELYEYWIKYVIQTIHKYLTKNKLSIDNFNRIIPHQANLKMISEIAEKLSYSQNKVIKNVSRNGNTAAASIPLALSQHKHLLKKWDRILMVSLWSGIVVWLIDIIWY